MDTGGILQRCSLPALVKLTAVLCIVSSGSENLPGTTSCPKANQKLSCDVVAPLKELGLANNSRYRTMDGSCNNLANPSWGAALTPYLRFVENSSETSCGRSCHQPEPDSLNNIASSLQKSNETDHTNEKYNMLLMQWGHLLAHDITLSSHSSNGRCDCEKCSPALSETATVNSKGSANFPQQHPAGCMVDSDINQNSAFLDGSAIYGSSQAAANELRDNGTAFLRMDNFGLKKVLPLFDHRSCSNGRCSKAAFRAGDQRVNIFVGLAALQTYMAREHNRLVDDLRKLNTLWSDAKLFLEARKIVGAEIQHITYKEWLPKILGSRYKQWLGGDQHSYNESIDPTIAIEFTAAAFRFGHGMITATFTRLEEDGSEIAAGNLSFTEGSFNFTDKTGYSERLINPEEGGPDAIIRGMFRSPIRRPDSFIPTLAGHWPSKKCTLASLDIRRGREQRVSSYSVSRAYCKQLFASTTLQNSFADTTASKDEVATDLFVGGMREEPVPGGMIGSTFACIVGDQFRRLRNGDRFFYQNADVFTAEQREEIQKASLARIMCDNGGAVHVAPLNAFELMEIENYSSCNETIPSINLRAWEE